MDPKKPPKSDDDAVRAPAVSKRHPARGALKGFIRAAPGVDLTEPADPEWADRIEKDYPQRLPAMTLAEFKRSISKAKPPADLAPALAALWWAGKDQWDKAHRIVMDEAGKDCAWVHAHLHRVEGDLGNARYWYRQAQRPVSTGPHAAEWDSIAKTLLAAQ